MRTLYLIPVGYFEGNPTLHLLPVKCCLCWSQGDCHSDMQWMLLAELCPPQHLHVFCTPTGTIPFNRYRLDFSYNLSKNAQSLCLDYKGESSYQFYIS